MSADLDALARAVAEARADWLDVDDEMETCAACAARAQEYLRCETHQARDCETNARMEAATAAYRAARRAR